MDMRRLIDLVEAQKAIQVDQPRIGWGFGGRVTTTVLLNPNIADMKVMIAKAPDNIVKGQVDTDGAIYI